jgi:hypothetical protein
LARVNSIDIKNCKVISLDSDTCSECNDGFELTQANELCVNHIPNCIEYNVTTVNVDGNHNYVCSRCIAKHYLDSLGNGGLGECKQGTILNCTEYIFNKNECVTCDFGFYLSDPITCTASNLKNISPNCLETDSTQPDTCLKCNTNFILLERVQECELADKFKDILSDEDSKCTKWTDATTCVDCYPMFYGTTCENETE